MDVHDTYCIFVIHVGVSIRYTPRHAESQELDIHVHVRPLQCLTYMYV